MRYRVRDKMFFKKSEKSEKRKEYHPSELDGDEAFIRGKDPTGMYEIALLHYLIALTTRPVPDSFIPEREHLSVRKTRADAEGKHEAGLEGTLRVIGKIEDYAHTLRDKNVATDLYVKTASYRTVLDGLTRIRNRHLTGVDSIRHTLGIATELDALEEYRAGLVVLYQKALRQQKNKG